MLADRARWTAVALLAASLLLAASARAQDEHAVPDGPTEAPTAPPHSGPAPRVYIVSVALGDGLDGFAARVGSAARSALRAVPNVDWQAADQAFLGYDANTLQTLTRARERLEEGRQAYVNLELDHATAALEGAVQDFDNAAPAIEDPHDLGEALLLLGASYAFNGHDRDATRIFRRIHTQMPDVHPDPDQFNPDIVQRFDAAAPPDAASPTSRIDVNSDPPGAIAYVDFLARGRTPTGVDGLIGGQHIVRVTRAGATPFVQPVDVRRGDHGDVNAFVVDNESTQGLHEKVAALATAEVERCEGAIAEVAQALDVDKLGVIRVSQGATADNVHLELLVFDVATGRRLLRGAGEVPTGSGALERGVEQLVAQGLAAALAPPRVTHHEVAPLPPPPPPPPHDDGVVGQWWFWTIVGVGVVAAAVIIAVVATSGGAPLGQDPGGQLVLRF